MEIYEERLQARGIKPTAIRLLIFKAMVHYPQAFSLTDLETILDTVDKSTLFRTITLFHEKLLTHSIDDGSGSMKYSVCSDHCTCSIGDLHVHFNCTRCHKTYCLESISIPKVKLPEQFLLESVNFVMKGLCAQCNQPSNI
ncbi:MAG: transcriptional repressor [Bacteroides sp.]|nr:transcriptional repressor [Bacteroides sp.]